MNENLPTARAGVRFDTDSGTYKSVFDAEDIAPSSAVVHAVGHVCDVDPLELAPLHDAIDAEALDAVMANKYSKTAFGDPTVSFHYQGYLVTVYSCGLLEIDPDADESPTG